MFNPCEDWVFAPETALFTVREHFKVASLDGFGLRDRAAAIGAAGAVSVLLDTTIAAECFGADADFVLSARAISWRWTRPRCATWKFWSRCAATRRRAASLYGAVNRTVTPMGARRLRDWLGSPLAEAGPILRRRDAVQLWLENGAALDEFRRDLAEVRDLERTLGRLASGSGNGRDLVSLAAGAGKNPRAQRRCFSPWRPGRPRAPDALRDLPMESDAGVAQSSPPSLIGELSGQTGARRPIWWS